MENYIYCTVTILLEKADIKAMLQKHKNLSTQMSAFKKAVEKNNAKNELRKIHPISNEDVTLLFNGTLDYKPNLDAVNYIINSINPELLKHKSFNYKLILYTFKFINQ